MMGSQFWFLAATFALLSFLDTLRSRPDEPDAVRALALTSLDFRSRGLVDRLIAAELPIAMVGSTAVISVRGVMMKSAPLWAVRGGYASSAGALVAMLRAAGADSAVESVLLDIDSPGGQVAGNEGVVAAVRQLAAIKPVHAHTSGMAASAAYRVAAQATRFTATNEAMVGSIGVILTLIDASKMASEAGIEIVQIRTGEFKGAGAFGTEVTDEQRQDFQRLVDQLFENFKADVIAGRRMNVAQLEQVADGRVFLGSEAAGLQLVDAVGTIDGALGELQARSTRPGDGLARARAQSLQMRHGLTAVGEAG